MSDKVRTMDERLERVRELIVSESRPHALNDQEFEALIRFAMRFFVHKGELWCRERSRQHQIVACTHKHYALLRAAHDKLGHKGVFSVRSCLSMCFWWPMLEQDIKWFVRTCHECQIW